MMGHPTIRCCSVGDDVSQWPKIWNANLLCEQRGATVPLASADHKPEPFRHDGLPVDTTIPQESNPRQLKGCLAFACLFVAAATCGIEPGWSYLEHFGALTFRASCVGLNASDVECFLGGKLRSRRGLAEEEDTTPDELATQCNGLLLGVLGSSTNLRA